MRQNNFSNTNSKVCSENTTILPALKEHFESSMNLVRIRLISILITSLCKLQTVTFERLAIGFDSTSDKDSSLRRIQRFFAGYLLDFDLISRLIFKLISKEDKIGLCMDRTNCKFGEANINILAIGVVYQGL